VIGIGNPGRRDDGLGPRLIERLRALDLPGVALDANYQLQIEDALAISRFDEVVFVDAARSLDAPFRLFRMAPGAASSFSTHVLAPEAVLALCRELYGRTPRARLLAVRGYDFEIGEALSAGAERNLEAALKRLRALLGTGKRSSRRRRARPGTRKPL
jgi:hydrogenase maturation protease